MAYWVINSLDGFVGPMLLQEKLWIEMGKNGLCPITERGVLNAEYGQKPIPLGLFTGDSEICTTRVAVIPDFMMLGGIPVFSSQAMRVAIDGACNETEFRSCVFQTNPDETYYLYLPTRSWDVLDYSSSKFLQEVPLSPPIPLFCQSARIKPQVEGRPCCFRVPVPGHSQMSADLFVDDRLKEPWASRGFKGATFRKVSDAAL